LKSFTRNPSNLQSLQAEKRFDALVKKQEGEHQHIISCHHKEMQELRELLLLAGQKFDALYGKNEHELKDFKTYTVCSLGVLKEKLQAHESIVSDQKKAIEDMQQLIMSFHLVYTKSADMDKFRKEVDERVKGATMSHLNSFQDLQKQLKELLKLAKDDFEKYKSATEKKFSELIDTIEKRFNVTKIDREGVLKEIRIYGKTIFIIEKKIENIYTLIERINKRGELCHKPE
jgi:hypothetical protein